MKPLLTSLAAGALLVTSAAVNCAPLTVGGGWAPFGFGTAGSSWDRTFDYSSSAATVFRVTDAGRSGDRFSVGALGLTSVPVVDAASVGGDYLAAFVNSSFSHGTYLLPAGAYAIGGTAVDSPFGGGVFAAARTDEVSVVAVAPGSGWHPFSFGGVDSAWNSAFIVSLPTDGIVTITDAGLSGDEFYVDGFGLTSTATAGGNVGNDFDAALADPRFSHLSLSLSAGDYLITGLATQSPFGSGVYAAVRVDLPEPGTFVLAGLGAAAALAARRRRMTAT